MALNVTGVTPPICAVTRLVPATVPSVHVVVATPWALVVEAEGFVDPEPALASQSTRTPPIARPLASVTTTLSGVASIEPTVPVWSVPVCTRSAAGVCVGAVASPLLEQAASAASSRKLALVATQTLAWLARRRVRLALGRVTDVCAGRSVVM